MGIMENTNPTLLENNAELLSKRWAKSIFFRMGYEKCRGTTTAKINADDFEILQETSLEQVKTSL